MTYDDSFDKHVAPQVLRVSTLAKNIKFLFLRLGKTTMRDPTIMSAPNASLYADKDDLRTRFAAAISAMYRAEVPLYGDLIDIVRGINTKVKKDITNATQPHVNSGIYTSIERLTQERHGAIRLGTPYELRTIKRIFEVMGMYPIGYYDLSVARLPMHATCFCPLTVSSFERNPFRVFTTLLRPELLSLEKAR